MPKIVVTDRLADTLKLLRMQNGIKSKDLAAHLGKTPGYISKLEKQEVKNIELETVESIFSFILGKDYKKTEIWEQIYASLQIKYSKAEIDQETWFANFDTVYRYIPIPDSIVDYLNNKIAYLDLSREKLLLRINANEALSAEIINNPKFKENIWYSAGVNEGSFIKIKISENTLANILDKKTLSSPYIFIFCILFYLLKIEKFGDLVNIDDQQIQLLNQETTNILNSHKFYSIVERDNIVNSAKSQEEIQNLLSSFDNNNSKLISEILNELKFASEIDIRITNKRLSSFLENLKKDTWFTLKIISLNYSSLESIDMPQRKEFIEKVESLIVEYTDNQKNIKNTETY